jgi:hypothetical protein
VAENTPVTPSRNRTVIVSSVQIPSLGRTTKTGRHRPVSLEDDPQAPGRELENYLAALAPDVDVETTGSGRRFGNAQVYQLRLQLSANEQLRELAAASGTSPQALAQEWVMQRLGWEAEQRATRVGAASRGGYGDAPAWPE